MNEEGHLFPRGEAIEVCTDTLSKLKAEPYAQQFAVLEPSSISNISITASSDSEQNCGTACCY
jgi:hypothetical protein